jgi:hypothetical protein
MRSCGHGVRRWSKLFHSFAQWFFKIVQRKVSCSIRFASRNSFIEIGQHGRQFRASLIHRCCDGFGRQAQSLRDLLIREFVEVSQAKDLCLTFRQLPDGCSQPCFEFISDRMLLWPRASRSTIATSSRPDSARRRLSRSSERHTANRLSSPTPLETSFRDSYWCACRNTSCTTSSASSAFRESAMQSDRRPAPAEKQWLSSCRSRRCLAG